MIMIYVFVCTLCRSNLNQAVRGFRNKERTKRNEIRLRKRLIPETVNYHLEADHLVRADERESVLKTFYQEHLPQNPWRAEDDTISASADSVDDNSRSVEYDSD